MSYVHVLTATIGGLCIAACATRAAGAEGSAWKFGEVRLPENPTHPFLACTDEELSRLRAAYKAQGTESEFVRSFVAGAEKLIRSRVKFPPRGGQHNQWYQCDKCQRALKTIDPTHHKCPKCGEVYTGEPYDDVLYARTHRRNLSQASRAGWAYAITGRDQFAEFAANVLLGYAERYEAYPYHSASRRPLSSGRARRSGAHMLSQTLDEAIRMSIEIAPTYDLIHDSGALSQDDHRQIREHLIRPILVNIDKNKARKSNWQTWHNGAMLAGGAMLDDVEWVRKALTDPENGFARQMEISVTGDGMWYENSWGYHLFTFGALARFAEHSRRIGIDIWSHPMLKKMCTLPVEYLTPDGRMPRFGDDTGSRPYSSIMELAWNAYRHPAIGVVLSAEPSMDSIMYGRDVTRKISYPEPASSVFPAAGHAILRTGGPGGLVAAMTFGPYGGFHGHLDKLSFVYYGWGRELGVDPGRASSQAYRLPIHGEWYKATLSHNTVVVGGKSQEPAAGTLECFAANSSFAAAVATCHEAHPAARHRRLLLLTPECLLVVDELKSDRETTFDWIYHNTGRKAICNTADGEAQLTGLHGSKYIGNVRGGSSNDTILVDFPSDEFTTRLLMAGQDATEVFTGDGPFSSIEHRAALVIVRRRGKSALFAAAIEPVKTGTEATVTFLKCTEKNGAITLHVQSGEHADEVNLPRDGNLTVSRDGRKVLEATD